MPDVTEIPEVAEARADELAETHHLSKARREGAALALADAHDRGEWPPSGELAVARTEPAPESPASPNATAQAAAVVAALRAQHVAVSGKMHAVILRALTG
jgi:hypothetical protein